MALDLFGDSWDVLVVIDDWRGGPNDPTAPIYFGGRTLRQTDRSNVDALYALLVEDGASAWHASGDRDKHSFLFGAPHFSEILALIESMDSVLLTALVSREDMEAQHIAEQWLRIRRDHPDLAAAWSESSPQARALFRYVDFALCHLAKSLPSGTRVRLIVDSLDWVVADRAPEVEPGVCCLGAAEKEIEAELHCIVHKGRSTALPLLPLLGLLDSEAWAFGRLQTLKFPNGETVRERCLARVASGGAWTPVCTLEEQHELLRPHRDHAQLLAYWAALMDRLHSSGRVVVLKERPLGRTD